MTELCGRTARDLRAAVGARAAVNGAVDAVVAIDEARGWSEAAVSRSLRVRAHLDAGS